MSSRADVSETTRKVVVVVNEAGDIIATAGMAQGRNSVTETHENQLETGLKALPGQSLHVVEMPDDFFRYESAIERHKWLAGFRIALDPEPRLIERYRAWSDT